MVEAVPLYPRPILPLLLAALADTPAVAIIGPRQCGKSTLARTCAPERSYVSLDDDAILRTARDDPAGFVAGLPDAVTLDEIQRAPELFRAIKAAVDRDRRPGRFLLTGSADLLLLPQLSESLAGRIEFVPLHPLTEAEKARAPGTFLATFLAGALRSEITGELNEPGMALAQQLVAGGYPEPLRRSPERARQWHRSYVRTLITRDVQDIARVKDVQEIGRLLEVLALRTGELLNTSNLGLELGLDRRTVEHYLAILERLFLIRRLPAWHRNEAKRLIKGPKVHLPDSGLAATLAGLTAAEWNTRRDRFGHLLESFVVQQLIAQAGWTDPDLRFWHYRDKDQVEVDLVVTRGRQIWGVEVKASASVREGDGHGLLRLAEQGGEDFKGGVLFHSGSSTLPMSDPRLLAVPLAKLWTL
jgi:predicted AAA+ superfamily ATPase